MVLFFMLLFHYFPLALQHLLLNNKSHNIYIYIYLKSQFWGGGSSNLIIIIDCMNLNFFYDIGSQVFRGIKNIRFKSLKTKKKRSSIFYFEVSKNKSIKLKKF